MRVDDPAVVAVLRESFGFSELRPRQAEAIQGVLDGRDVLLTMPTGSGKSLVYQLPAIVLPGMTLVVSPLIALMKDQVDGLVRRGIRASFVNSSISGGERERRLQAAARGVLDLLFVTPERFRSPRFREILPNLDIQRLAVDEAHCISHWGHDFRPDYSRLGEYRALIGGPPTLALTATATPRVAEDICGHLGLRKPLVIRTGIERENLFFAARAFDDGTSRLDHLAERLRAMGGAGIVYATLIRDLEEIQTELRRRGVPTLVYHGGLSAEERRGMQDRFMGSADDVVLATNAFGMGVDKADIRFVIHAQIPRNLEAWTQEVGRAGRDGLPAFCEVLYLEQDLAIQQSFVKWANPSLEYLLGIYETLRGWGERIQTRDLDDLRDELLVKSRGDNRVGICLKWLEVLGVTEGSFEAHDLRLARELDPASLPPFLRSGEKHREDLEALLGMVHFARDRAGCRRQLLARHFALPEPPTPCGACDHCADSEDWLRKGLPGAGRGVVDTAQGATGAPFARGDWVRVDGRHLGQVVRVEGAGRRLRLIVESTQDLKRRTVDPQRQRVEKLES